MGTGKMKEIYKEQLTWITGRKGEKIAFKDMPVDLACEILKLIDEYDREGDGEDEADC